jgi:hypothetical protein
MSKVNGTIRREARKSLKEETMFRRVTPLVVGLALVVSTGFAADVALFNNGTYVDWIPGATGSEASNLYDTLLSQGHTVFTFTGITAADFTTATAGRDVLAIPELERGDLNAALDAAARTAIATYVQGGGTLWVFGSTADRAYSLLNATFGYSISGGSMSSPCPLNNSDAVGTSFEGGPVSIPYNDDTTAIVTSSLPPGSLVIYEASSGPADSVVTLIPEGAGWIVFFGWDWYNAAPTGTEDGGWLEVLDRGVTPGGLVAVEVPTLSQWGMITMVLFLATMGAFLVARRRLI